MLKPVSRTTLTDVYDRGAIRVVHYLICRFGIALGQQEASGMLQQWRTWLDNVRRIFRTLLNLEEIMGATARELAGVVDQLAKIREEVANAGQLDAEDLAVLQAVKDGINAVDVLNPDAAPEPAPETPAEPAPSDPEF